MSYFPMHCHNGSAYLSSNLPPRRKGGGLTTITTIQLHWSMMNTTIHKMMKAISSGGRRWLLSSVGVWQQGGSSEYGVWQRQQQVAREGTQQSINYPLQWTMIRWRGQQEGECNNRIEVKYVRGEQAVDDTTGGGSGQRKASGWQTMQQEGGGRT
jgi:hypothetical protein